MCDYLLDCAIISQSSSRNSRYQIIFHRFYFSGYLRKTLPISVVYRFRQPDTFVHFIYTSIDSENSYANADPGTIGPTEN
jgi:hypothetical protein